jgi:MoxR-like ATPase
MSTKTLSKEMRRAEFEALVEQTYKIISDSGLSTPEDKLRADILGRFANLHGISVEDAERLLDEGGAEAVAEAVEPEKEASPEERKEALKTMARHRTSTKEGPYFWEPPQDANFMDMVVALRREAKLVANLMITGPSGAGKTEGIIRAGKRLGIPVYKVDCASVTTDDRWIGHKEIDAKGTHYVLSEHLRWISAKDVEPGIVLYDEITRLHPTRTNILFPILDGSQRIWVPDLNAYIDVHPDTVFMATANIGTGFTGTHRLDDALEGRFGYRLERTFPPPEQERMILEKRTGIDKAKAKMLVEIAVQTRRKVETADLSKPVSTRNLLETAALVAAGMRIDQAAEYTFIKFYSEEGSPNSERVMVRQIVTGKSAGK